MAKDKAIKGKVKPKAKPKAKAKAKSKAKPAVKAAGKMGAPTKYRPEHCALVIELMKEGASKAEVCLNLDCTFQTFLNWQAEYPDFLEAVKRGSHLSKGKWEEMGRKAAFGTVENFNATAWIFNMKNRFGRTDDLGEKWSDKQELEHSGEVVTFNMDFGAKKDPE